jgi:hypothetical protein
MTDKESISEALAGLPEELRAELQDAVESADFQAVLSIVERIQQQNEPLADALETLARGYRFDTLQTVFEKKHSSSNK